ncbi:unnamed protein product [Phytophthora lilii]|uniref:Unnamed protein product n=1 Tax=Phytophthora lilii TaxID=2077276 RepID=A0A9W6WXG0_9STRA|nr:unnamed protein product [Phytophthora lilii]
MPPPLTPGDRVEGKNKKLAGWRGVVLTVNKESRMRSYKVQWDSGVLETVSARSIRREVGVAAWTPPDLAREARQEEGDTGVGEADSSSDMSISNSLSDEESVSTASSTVAVGGGDSEPRLRTTEVCVLTGGNGYIVMLYTLTPRILSLRERHHFTGHRICSWGNARLHLTSISCTPWNRCKLRCKKRIYCWWRRQGVIGRGEFFRWIGIRLAKTLEPRRGPLTVYWNSSVTEGSVGTAANFGQLYGN